MQTIIGTFDSASQADTARRQLVAGGFDDTAIHLTATTAATTYESRDATHASSADDMSPIARFFSNLFGGADESHDTAGHYTEAVRRGSVVLAVDARDDGQERQARQTLQTAGAIDIDERVESWKARGYTGYDPEREPRTFAHADIDTERQAVVPIVEEELQVGKRTVSKGGVRVIRRTVETPVSEMITLRDEHVSIERRPVQRAATQADLASMKDGVIELTETAEEAVVSKTARVVEEVEVGTVVSEREHKVKDTVRRTDVDVERIDEKAMAARGDSSRPSAGPASGRTESTGKGKGVLGRAGDAIERAVPGDSDRDGK